MADVYSCIYLDSDYVDGTESYAGELNATNRDAKYGDYPTPGRYFTSVAAWESNRDGDSSGGNDEYGRIIGLWTSAETVAFDIGITGWNADAIILECPLTVPDGVNLARHNGIFGDVSNSYILDTTSDTAILGISDADVTIDGIQLHLDSVSSSQRCIDIYSTGTAVIRNVVISTSPNGVGIRVNDSGRTVTVESSVISDPHTAGGSAEGLEILAASAFSVYNCTIQGSGSGLELTSGTVDVVNCAVFNNSDDFQGSFNSIDYCASDDGDGTNEVDWTAEATDWAANFNDYVNEDFTPLNVDLPDAGIGPASDANVPTTDIIGNTLSGTTCTIGAFQYQGGAVLDFLSTAALVTVFGAIDLDKLLNFLSASSSVTVATAVDMNVSRLLLSTSNAVSTLSSVDLDKLLSFLSTSSWQTVLSSIDLNTIRLLNSTVANQTAFSAVDLNIIRLLNSTVVNQTVFSAVDLLINRLLLSTSNAVSTLSSIDLDRLLNFLSTVSGQSILSGINLPVSRLFASIGSDLLGGLGDCVTDFFDTVQTGWTHNAGAERYDCDGSQTGDSELIELTILELYTDYKVQFTISNYNAGTIELSWPPSPTVISDNGTYIFYVNSATHDYMRIKANVDFIGSIDDITVNVETIIQSVLSPIDLLVDRQLSTSVNSTTVLSSIDLLNLISFISTLAIQTVLSNIDLDKLLLFLSTSTATTTLSGIDLDKLLSFLSTSNIVSVFSNIDLLLTGLIDFLSTVNIVTTLSGIDLNRVMLLLSTVSGQSILSPADLNVTRLLSSTATSQIVFTTVDLLISRLLTSTAVGQTTLSSIDLTRLMNIVSVVSTQTTLSSVDVNVLMSLLSTVGITSDLSSVQLNVLRNVLSTVNIVTLLSTIVLLSGTIENIITTSIKDASTSYIVKDLTKNMMNIKQLLTYTVTNKSDILDALYSLGDQNKVIGASSYNITNKSDVLSIREISQEE